MTNVSLPKTPILLQLYARAEAPCRDYYGLTITETNLLLHAWKITHGPHAYPRKKISDIEDFKYDKYLQEELKNVFSGNVMEYLYDLANGRRKLGNLPPKAFLNIVRCLTVNDVFRLAQTSKIFHELCNTDLVWRLIFMKILKRSPSPEEKKMARDMGWKEVLRKRLTYIRKIYAERNQSHTRINPQSVKSATQLKPVRPTPTKKSVEQRYVKPVVGKAVDQKPGGLSTGKVFDQKPVRPSMDKIAATKTLFTHPEVNLVKKAPVEQKNVTSVMGKPVDQKPAGHPAGKVIESIRPSTGKIVDQKATKTLFTHSEASLVKATPVEQRHVKSMVGKAVDQKPGGPPTGTVLEQKSGKPSTDKNAATKTLLTHSEFNLVKKVPVEQRHVKPVVGKSVDQKTGRQQVGKVIEQKSIRPSTGKTVDQKATKTTLTHSEAKVPVKTSEQTNVKTSASNKPIMVNNKMIHVK